MDRERKHVTVKSCAFQLQAINQKRMTKSSFETQEEMNDMSEHSTNSKRVH